MALSPFHLTAFRYEFAMKRAPRFCCLFCFLLLMPFGGAVRAQGGAASPAPASAATKGEQSTQAATDDIHYYNFVRFYDAQDLLMYDDRLINLCPDLTKRNPTDRHGMRKLNRTRHPVLKESMRA
ncbi:MAG: hypothetical protein NVS3B25_11780 [Hymenobacter sp.]